MPDDGLVAVGGLFPNVGSATAQQIIAGDVGCSACMHMAERSLHTLLW